MAEGAGKKVLVGLSGGPESAVAAALLKSQGYLVAGIHFQFGSKDFGTRCTQPRDLASIRKLCEKLDVPLHVVDVTGPFEAEVVDDFVHERAQVRLPNPCVACTCRIKLPYLDSRARSLGFEWIATGHYARVLRDELTGEIQLFKGNDPTKDQSGLLFAVSREALGRLLLPLGGFSARMVEKLAVELGITEPKAMSLDDDEKPPAPPPREEICLVGGISYRKFVEARIPPEMRPGGSLKQSSGETVGKHEGLFGYRLGQKEGLLYAKKTKEQEAFVVVGLDPKSSTVVVGTPDKLFQNECLVTKTEWVCERNGIRREHCRAKLGPDRPEVACVLTHFENRTAHVFFEEPQAAIMRGMVLSFIEGEEVIGGGWIEHVGPQA